MEYTDITNLTRTTFNNSPFNKSGVFEPPLGYIKRFKMALPLQDSDLDKAFETFKASAFDDIGAANPDRPLVRLDYNDLSTKIHSYFEQAMICQISMLITNGLSEITQTSQNSNAAFSSTVDSNTRIITTDQLDTDTEDALNKMQYYKWRVVVQSDGAVDIIIGDISVVSAKTANGVALSALTFLGLDANDLTFLGENKVIDLINLKFITANKAFLGTWNAKDQTEIDDIDNIFNTTGLILTNGKTITPANTTTGNTIAIDVPTDNDYLTEEALWDENLWKIITNNNQEQEDKKDLQNQIDNLDTNKAEKTEVVDNTDPKGKAYRDAVNDEDLVMLKQLITELAIRDVEIKANKDKLDPLPTLISELGSRLVEQLGGTIADLDAMAKDPADGDADVRLMTSARVVQLIAELKTNVDADTAELNKGKFDVNGDGTKITEIFDANGDLKQNSNAYIWDSKTTEKDFYAAVHNKTTEIIYVGSNSTFKTEAVSKTTGELYISFMYPGSNGGVPIIWGAQIDPAGTGTVFDKYAISPLEIGPGTLPNHAAQRSELDSKAQKDLTNVNVGIANAGKYFSVSANGNIDWVDAPSGGGSDYGWVEYLLHGHDALTPDLAGCPIKITTTTNNASYDSYGTLLKSTSAEGYSAEVRDKSIGSYLLGTLGPTESFGGIWNDAYPNRLYSITYDFKNANISAAPEEGNLITNIYIWTKTGVQP